MKKLTALFTLAAVALMLAGCATSTQTALETRYDENGVVVADIQTRTRVRTFITSSQSAKSIKSSNSEDAQTVEIADINQESDVTQLIQTVVKSAVEAGVEATAEAVNPLE